MNLHGCYVGGIILFYNSLGGTTTFIKVGPRVNLVEVFSTTGTGKAIPKIKLQTQGVPLGLVQDFFLVFLNTLIVIYVNIFYTE